jgi:hypothetical protein
MDEKQFRIWVLSLLVVGVLGAGLLLLSVLDKVSASLSGGVYEAAIALSILFLFDVFAGLVLA